MQSIEDTIVAVSSPPGPAIRAIIRISGPRAFDSVTCLLRSPRDLTSVQNFSSMRPELALPEHGLRLPVWLYLMRAPHTYTGEDLVEIHLCGNPSLVSLVMSGLCRSPGVRPAGPGEFTLRAFLNGKMDLFQAESVVEVIHSRDEQELAALHSRERSGMAARVKAVEDALLDLCAEVEAAIDFVDQDIEIIAMDVVKARLDRMRGELEEVLRFCREGDVTEARYKILLYGAPNVGKSTLFNRLVPHGRVIVSDRPGTTRDVIEGQFEMDTFPVSLFDAAGIMERPEGIDAEAVRRVQEVIRRMDLILRVMDVEAGADRKSLDQVEGIDTLTVVTKCDLKPGCVPWKDEVCISARTGEGLEELRRRIGDRIRARGAEAGGARVTVNQRQYHVLQQARAGLDRAAESVREDRGIEFIAFDLREALHHLGSFTGRDVGDDILTRIFERFCIGK